MKKWFYFWNEGTQVTEQIAFPSLLFKRGQLSIRKYDFDIGKVETSNFENSSDINAF